ncbi:FtsK/SpoIIIE domain-containing protein [Kitasatospora sp. NPDC001683]
MTLTIRAEIAENGPQAAVQGRVTSRPVKTETAGQTPSTIARLCTWCTRRRYEIAPAGAHATITGLAWAQHLAGVTPGVGLAYTLGTLALGSATGWALQKGHAKLAVGTGTAAAAVAEAGINAVVGPGATGLVTTAVAAIGSYTLYWPWLLERRRKLAPAATPGALAATPAGADAPALAVVTPGTGSPELEAAEGLALADSPVGIRETQNLRDALAALGIAPLAVDNYTADANGWSALVTLPAGRSTSPATVKAQREQLSNNMGLSGRLRLSTGPSGNQLLVKVDLHDALADPIPWPGPSITTVKEPMSLGLFEDGEEILLDLAKDHILIGGATDAGKSGVENAILGNLAACSDAMVLGIDMKPGALELGPWESTMMMLAEDADQAAEVFSTVKAEMIRRGKYLATLTGPDGERVRKWVAGDPEAPTDSAEWGHGPFWYLIIDELAELFRQAPDLVKELLSLNQVARALGIRIIAATQSPSEKAFGGQGTDARQQYGTRIGLGVNEPITVNLILGPGSYGAGWTLDDLDKPGKLMISNKTHKRPREGRCYWISDAQILATSRLHPKTGMRPTPPNGGPGGRFLKSVPAYPDGTRIPDNRVELWQAIDRRGASGVTINGLLADGLTGLNTRTSISDPVQTWKARGWVVEVGVAEDRSKIFAVASHLKAA